MFNLRRTIRRWLDSDYDQPLDCETRAHPMPEGRLEGPKFSFSIVMASGGHIVEVFRPEANSYKNTTIGGPSFAHYVIPDGSDFNEALGKIITIEMLRNS